MGFLQKKSSVAVAARARDMVASMMKKSPHKSQLELIEFGLKAKKVDFSKVIAMIDGMATVLKEEQKNDDSQKAFCDKDLEKSEEEKKIKALDKAVAEATEQRKEEHADFLQFQTESE